MGVRCPSSFLFAYIHYPSCLILVPELIEEELYLEVDRGAGGGPLPRPPIGRLRLSSPRVGGSRSLGPARLGSSLFSDSVSEAVEGSELGPERHSGVQSGSLTSPHPRFHPNPQTGNSSFSLRSLPASHLFTISLKLPPRPLPLLINSTRLTSLSHNSHHRQDRPSSGPGPGPHSCPHKFVWCGGRRKSSHQWYIQPCHCRRCPAHSQEGESPAQSAEVVHQFAASPSEAAPPPGWAEDGGRNRRSKINEQSPLLHLSPS